MVFHIIGSDLINNAQNASQHNQVNFQIKFRAENRDYVHDLQRP